MDENQNATSYQIAEEDLQGLLHNSTEGQTEEIKTEHVNVQQLELEQQQQHVHVAEQQLQEHDGAMAQEIETAEQEYTVIEEGEGIDPNSLISAEVVSAAAAAAAATYGGSLLEAAQDIVQQQEIAQLAAQSSMVGEQEGQYTATGDEITHEQHLANRRQKDRERYASMSKEQRDVYNHKRREQYHRQSETSRKKRRERERERYHSLPATKAKERNVRRAALERERYKKLNPVELAARNAKRRARAAALRAAKKAAASGQTQTLQEEQVGIEVPVQHHHVQELPMEMAVMQMQVPMPQVQMEHVAMADLHVEMGGLAGAEINEHIVEEHNLDHQHHQV